MSDDIRKAHSVLASLSIPADLRTAAVALLNDEDVALNLAAMILHNDTDLSLPGYVGAFVRRHSAGGVSPSGAAADLTRLCCKVQRSVPVSARPQPTLGRLRLFSVCCGRQTAEAQRSPASKKVWYHGAPWLAAPRPCTAWDESAGTYSLRPGSIWEFP